jgi:hypothetical protein
MHFCPTFSLETKRLELWVSVRSYADKDFYLFNDGFKII